MSEAAEAAGVRISPRHAEKTVGGMPAVGGKAAVQWQEWLRKEKGLKLELTPIATSGLAWQRGVTRRTGRPTFGDRVHTVAGFEGCNVRANEGGLCFLSRMSCLSLQARTLCLSLLRGLLSVPVRLR